MTDLRTRTGPIQRLKEERARQLNAVEVPILRCIGSAFISLGVFLNGLEIPGIDDTGERITDDSFLVFSSNVCALLGLRALYFVVRGALVRLRYLKPGLAAILLFVGLKMLLYRWVHLPTGTSLAVIAGILVVAIAVSWLRAPPPG